MKTEQAAPTLHRIAALRWPVDR